MLYSTRALFSKLDVAVGQFIASLALIVVAFPTKASPGQVSQETLNHLGWIEGPAMLIPGLIAMVRDVIRELVRHGVRKVCAIVGHYENQWIVTEGIDLIVRVRCKT